MTAPKCTICDRTLLDGETAWADDVKAVDLATGAVTLQTRYTCDDCFEAVYGACTACGAVEVKLVKATGVRDLSGIGESPAYPTSYGCEVCA